MKEFKIGDVLKFKEDQIITVVNVVNILERQNNILKYRGYDGTFIIEIFPAIIVGNSEYYEFSNESWLAQNVKIIGNINTNKLAKILYGI